jgi:cytochrome c biogenesis protein
VLEENIMTGSKQNPIDAIWDFFCSLKLSISTLILLATTSIIGTVIEQGSTPEAMTQKHGWSLSFMQFLDTYLDAFNMYHSWWFIGLLGLFAVNLICCSIKRLPRVWSTVQNPVLIPDDNMLRSFSTREEFAVNGEEAAIKEKVSAFLAGRFSVAKVTEKDGKTYFYAEKGAWSRFGVYVTHLSILIIFIGALMGSFWGYKAYVNIPEGGQTDTVYRRDKQAESPLGFAVRCEAFSVSYYEGTNRPREFKSILSVIDNGQVVIKDRKVIVNEPLTYKGITFYQSSYGQEDTIYTFQVTERATGKIVTVTGREKEHIPLPGGASLIPQGYAENYQNSGPAAQLNIDSGNHQHGSPFIVLQNFPSFGQQQGGAYSVALSSAKQRFYTGLQVAKDPGVEVVWLGCFFIVIGTMVAFFMSHRRIWVVLSPGIKGMNLLIAGNANRNQPAFEIAFDELKKEFKNEFSS